MNSSTTDTGMKKMNFLEAAIKSARKLVEAGLAVHEGDKAKALAYAKERSVAGNKVWEVIEAELAAK